MTTPTPPSDLIAEMAKAIQDEFYACVDEGPPKGDGMLRVAQAAYAVVRERIEVLTKAAQPFADSIVIDPTKKRGDRHWATYGKPTDLDDVLRLQSALKQRIDP